MKKAVATLGSLGFLAFSSVALAETPIDININIPSQGVNPFISIGTLISNALIIVFVVAAILVLFYLVIGAFQWITSGGEKEAVGHARSRITRALIGLAILALAFLITRVAGQIVGIDILNIQRIPTLSQPCPAGTVFDPTSSQQTGQTVCIPEAQPPAGTSGITR